MFDHINMLEELQQILNTFDGGAARLWHFTASHNRLALRLKASANEDVVYVLFLLCSEISLPVKWKISQPEIKIIGKDKYQFKDEKARIVFAESQLHAEYDPSA